DTLPRVIQEMLVTHTSDRAGRVIDQDQGASMFFYSSRRRHTRSVSAFLLNRSSDLHRPEGDEKWFLENEKTVTQFCRKLAAERPLKDIRDEYNYPKKKGIKDECSRLLEASTMKSRRGFAIQRLMN